MYETTVKRLESSSREAHGEGCDIVRLDGSRSRTASSAPPRSPAHRALSSSTSTMDPQHADDMARISLESIHDWHRLKSNYTTAALRAFDDELKGARSTAERDALLAHLHQVRRVTQW